MGSKVEFESDRQCPKLSQRPIGLDPLRSTLQPELFRHDHEMTDQLNKNIKLFEAFGLPESFLRRVWRTPTRGAADATKILKVDFGSIWWPQQTFFSCRMVSVFYLRFWGYCARLYYTFTLFQEKWPRTSSRSSPIQQTLISSNITTTSYRQMHYTTVETNP